jgi:hypothetical protein
MTTPPAPTPPAPPDPAPPAPPAPPSADPPAPQPPAPPAPPRTPEELLADLARVTAALDQERRQRAAVQGELTKLRNAGLSDQERAVEAAKAAGRAEALQAAGLRLAAAEFRVAAVGKIADPGAALELLDLAKFVDEAGEVKSADLTAYVERLAAALPAPPQPGRIPAGPQGTPATDDFLRATLRGPA